MINTFIRYILFGAMMYLGLIWGDKLFSILSKWATRRQHTLLSRAFFNSPDSTMWERLIILSVLMAMFSTITVNFDYKGSILCVLTGLAFSFLENSYTLLKGYLIVKKAGDNITEEELANYNQMGLDDEIYEQIVELSEEGNKLIGGDSYDEAIDKYNAALDLVPQPKHEWEASTWIYSSIGDAYFLKEEYEKAMGYFYNAMNCPDGITNPFILLRLGESLFECEEFEKAKEYLLKAYMLEGYKIFNEEDEKYFNLIKEMI